jgi:hypothetical protein
MKSIIFFLVLTCLLFWQTACKPGAGSQKAPLVLLETPTPQGLSFSDPVEFPFSITNEQAGNATLELEIIFDPVALGDGNQLPLYYQWVLPDLTEKDKRISVVVKENGNWLGEVHDDATRRKITYALVKDTPLVAGNHELRIFADTGLNQPLTAISHLIFRVR